MNLESRRSSVHSRSRIAWWLGVVFFWPPLHAVADSGSAADSAWQTDPYQLGEGLYFPQQGLRVGGYADVRYYDLTHQTGSASVEDLSLFLTKDIGTRWKIFNETEISSPLTITGHGVSTSGASLEIERLYADYFASTWATIRIGRFLTPIGEWNLIHADPLVWTTSRPLSTAAAFSRSANGAMLYGTHTVAHNDLDYTLYVDDTQAIGVANDADNAYSTYGALGAPDTLTNAFERAAGGQVHYHLREDLIIGTSLVTFELKDPRAKYRLAGLDFDWQAAGVELSGESVYRTAGRLRIASEPQISSESRISSEYGGYLQMVVPLPDQVFLVARYEHYRSAALDETDNIGTLGLNYRPAPGLVVKLEHDSGTHKSSVLPSGWLASFAVLF